MIPRVARLGTGFNGAGQYYLNDVRKLETFGEDTRPTAGDYMLHDKGDTQSATRVGFTATRNLPTTDPKKALRCMSWLAANAQNVRQAAVAAAAKAAGQRYEDYVRKENPFRGRKGSKPVYTLSLAWHPSKDHTPTPSEMLQAADEVLKTLGLEDHQALIVQHTDTAHPHVHLIVNRVSPINGKYASVSNDYLKLSWWAMHHEKRTGFVLCHERIFNWEKRHQQRNIKAQNRQNNPKAKGCYVRHKQTPRVDHDWFKRHSHLSPDEIREARANKQRKETTLFALKQSAALLRFDQRLSRTTGREQKIVAKERQKIEHQLDAAIVKSKPRTPLGIFRKSVRSLSPQRFFKKRAVSRLVHAEAQLTDLMETKRTAKRDQLGTLWRRMERRHAAERRRDEERIAKQKRQGRSESAARHAKHLFRIEGGSQELEPRHDTSFFDAVNSEKQAPSLKPIASTEKLVRPRRKTDLTKFEQPEKQQVEPDANRKTRIAKRIDELERQDRQRRKRKRPRGKSRRRD